MSPRPIIPTNSATRRALAGLAGLAALKAAAMVLALGALAHALAQWAGTATPDHVQLMVQGSAGAVLLGGTVWGQAILARRAALGTKEELRARLVAHRLTARRSGAAVRRGAAGRELPEMRAAHGTTAGNGAASSVGAEGMLASRGLDGLDDYFSAYLPALVGSAILPLAFGVQILITDWVSALVLVLSLPLVPVFMILIGFHTQERVDQAAHGLDRLSNHLLELAQGLPVLVGLRRAGAQRRALEEVCEGYRKSTMATLRTAFLSSMALELISTISVAVVAVFIGVRLVSGDMSLEAGLLALMLAPECFKPLRDVGAAHHGSEDGVEALRRVKEILDEDATGLAAGGARAAGDTPAPSPKSHLQDPALEIQHLSLSYPGRATPAVHNFSTHLRPGELLVLDGASGTGKSTILDAVAGTLPSTGAGAPILAGAISRPDSSAVVYVSQHPLFTETTVLAELALYAGGPHGLKIDADTLKATLSRVNAAHLTHRSIVQCSPGELRRVAVARALARIAADPAVELALFDEPTAHLDPDSARAVREQIAQIRGTVAMIVATHDPILAALATVRPSAGHTRPASTGAENNEAASGVPATTQSAREEPNEKQPDEKQPNEKQPEGEQPDEEQRWSWRQSWRLLRHLPLRSPRFALGVLMSVLATLAAAALAGVSGWLIVWAAAQPPMMYLMTLIVGVRAFGIGRSVLRYCERLLVHDAVFRWATDLRLKLWDAMGGSVVHWGRLSRTGGALGTLVADVDELRDAVPRAIVPIPAAVLSFAAVMLTTHLFIPEVDGLMLALAVLALVVLPVLVVLVQRRASAAAAIHRIWLAGRTTTLLQAAPQLAANGVGELQARRFAAEDAAVAKPLRRLAGADGLGQGGVALLTTLAAVAAGSLGIAAGADPRSAAVVALLMLALAEPLGQYLVAISALPALTTLMRRTLPMLDVPHTVVTADGSAAEPASDAAVAADSLVEALEVQQISARYPDGVRPVFSQISGGTRRGDWWTVSGPSGSGKSTLLAVLLGFLTPDAGQYTIDGHAVTAAGLARIAWGPQESHLFNSSLRANLALARPSDAPPSDTDLTQALAAVGLGPWLADLPDGLDTRVGPGGHNLSGGQRTRVSVARMLVANADVVLLDEPTAHLGVDEAARMMAELRVALAGTAVVLVTHDAGLAAWGDTHLRLGETVLPVAA